MYVVDTDICVDILRGRAGMSKGLSSLEREGRLAVASVTAHELWQGAFATRDPEGAAAGVDRFLAAFDVLAYSADVARVGGKVSAALRAAGRPIGDLDTMIAATALARQATLVTRNVRHFRRVAELTVHEL